MTPDLRARFEPRAVRQSYSILFLRPDDALDLIEAARQQAKPVLGIDAFVVTDTTVQPFLEHSIDYSIAPTSRSKSWSDAKQFIEQRRDLGFVFEIVV